MSTAVSNRIDGMSVGDQAYQLNRHYMPYIMNILNVPKNGKVINHERSWDESPTEMDAVYLIDCTIDEIEVQVKMSKTNYGTMTMTQSDLEWWTRCVEKGTKIPDYQVEYKVDPDRNYLMTAICAMPLRDLMSFMTTDFAVVKSVNEPGKERREFLAVNWSDLETNDSFVLTKMMTRSVYARV